MGNKTEIQWTDATWNPIRGCTRVSDGCRNCYAERVAMRFSGKGQPYEGLVQITNGHPQWTGKVQFVEKHLADPLKWKEPRRIFVNSMSDLFHEGVTDAQLDAILAVMAQADQHTFQILTKRPERMLAYFRQLQAAADEHAPKTMTGSYLASDVLNIRNLHRFPHSANAFERKWPLGNVWLGVSCENQKAADERIQILLQTPAAVRWVSAEPLLGPILLDNGETSWLSCSRRDDYTEPVRGEESCCESFHDGGKHFRGIDWVVAGGESGPGARPMHPEWARSLRDQCQAAGVAFFFKQWGAWNWQCDERAARAEAFRLTREGRNGSDLANAGDGGDVWMYRVGKKSAGRLLDGKEWNQYPEAKALCSQVIA
jgi:protein gp37